MEKLEKLIKLLTSSTLNDKTLAINILNTEKKFTAYYCYRHIKVTDIPTPYLESLVHPYRRATTKELHRMATTVEELNLVRDLYLDTFMTIANPELEQISFTLELKLYEQPN